MTSHLLAQLDARDRAIFARWTGAPPSVGAARFWTTVTHLGGGRTSVLAVLLPWALGTLLPDGSALRRAAALAALVLIVSHLLVRAVKRVAGRPRPAPADPRCRLIDAPPCFSFPSGHSAAAMSVAAAYGIGFPALAPLLLFLAVVVGASRVRLGVHYPGDVLAGQLITLATAAGVAAASAWW